MTSLNEALTAAIDADEAETLDEGSPETGGAADTQGEGSEASETSYFDLDQYGDQLVKIKVDGEEQDVPLKELQSGYMRQAAFTQKTQQLAAERARLQSAETLASAYERNPAETIRFLAQQNGLTLAEAKAVAEAAGDEQEGTWANDVDPRVSALEQQIAALQQREAREDLERTLTHLGNLYGDEFDANEVVNRALQIGTSDIESVFKQMAFDRMFTRTRAEQEVAQRTAAEEAQRTAAKQQLASTVASGQSFNGAGEAGSAPISTVVQALEAAFAAAGESFDF